MSAIKFRKRFTKFKITIALPKKFGSKDLIKAGLYRKAVQVCIIPIPSDIYYTLLCNEAMIASSTVRAGFKTF